MASKKKFKISYNSPVVLTFALISLIALIIGYLTGGASTKLLFMTYRSSLLNPLTYVRLFTHAIGHANISHYVGNFMYILLVGPMLEEKYGSSRMLIMMLFTAGITGIINSIFFPTVALCGASGIVFMMILLSSFANSKENDGIPLTMILIAIIYLGNQIIQGIFIDDNVSQFGHLIGGVCGAIFGYALRPKSLKSKY
ncbi:MAG: rhomboid family intramembrane serine protease [Ruminococcus sp.]|nr:rhomboid family intramembrane serine protease [Ruminococcus sp.]MCD7800419.1 rhomboid family intramembrane serine protease [Ruminococcus sp.]